ncbi:hypothetical protein [Treponema pedis]|uniref:hypothetical protein n=1 Tax=Treponema pedis TaxID=409322 RepID=UPI000423943B|nr:hypothetical protein [Treponema pedis]
MVQITELEKQVLKQEYPQLSLSDDLDIERYFELRKTGFMNEALSLYNEKLKRKYPDEKMRVELMSCYRQKSPRFQELLTQNLITLAQKTIVQIKHIISFITEKISNLNPNDVYNVIQQCEHVVSAISNDRFAAISFTQKFSRYAAILNFKENAMKKSAELIRLYVTDTLSSVNEYKAEQEELALRKRQAAVYRPKPAFDFSKIIFTKEQTEAIIIPETIKSEEDKVIAYMLKYWPMYSNSAFENAVLLYSRKYKTNHFNIFQAVKIGRYRGWKDEEIIQAVLLNIVSGYYYSISGDLYLQRQWSKVKATLPQPGQKTMQNAETRKALPPPKENLQKALPPAKQKTVSTDIDKDKKERKKAKEIKPKIKKVKTQKKISENKKTEKKLQENKTVPKTPKLFVFKKREKPILPAQPELKPAGSIAEIIQLMTGSSYKLHKGMFFENIRTSIRKELDKQTVQTVSVFKSEYVDAENLIYDFFEENYDNPFQNWEASEQHKGIEKLGFILPSIEPIIKDWIREKL